MTEILGAGTPVSVETAMLAALCLDVLDLDPDYLPGDREARALAKVREVYENRQDRDCLRAFAYELWREVRNG